ncbi:ATP-dependent endonuclease [Thermodesulfobacteriota bacterium]
MKIESVSLKGFRCFGPEGATIAFEDSVTALVGGNGAGKTALLLALSRLFGVTPVQRTVRQRDFHLPPVQQDLQSGANMSIDIVLSFPELDGMAGNAVGDAVPEFFLQMAASEPGAPLKVRIILKATWTDDGTPSGSVEEDIRWVRVLDDNYDRDDDCQKVPAVERSTIQLVYVPATRNVQEQVTSLLKGRLWQAAKWSEDFRRTTADASREIQETFQDEDPAMCVLENLKARWKQLHDADTDSTPILRLVERRFEEFVRKADFAFYPDEAGQERALADLSDGQRSLFHIALTAATLEVERDAFALPRDESAFDQEKLRRAHLTILAIEEPENSLSPFFLSRIIAQARDIGALDTAQVVLSSHSAAILSRIEPKEVRYFWLDRISRHSSVRKLRLPTGDAEASQYLRLAIRAYPELYFARFVILAEGESEKLVIPRIAEAMGISLDPSFVPIVPLGGRYCMHFWTLLSDLKIPYATLLDFDIGRAHGGAKIIRSIAENLTAIGIDLNDNPKAIIDEIDPNAIDDLEDDDLWQDYEDNQWVQALEDEGVFLSDPLDLDFAMLEAFPDAYKHPNPGGQGPHKSAKALENAKAVTLKTDGDATLYEKNYDEAFRWYPYLFLHRSKPDTHLAALTRITDEQLSKDAPPSLKSLIKHVKDALGFGDDSE